jgi:hypothetical protein
MKTGIKIFEEQKVRTVWDEETEEYQPFLACFVADLEGGSL